jgi:hypothetical protein
VDGPVIPIPVTWYVIAGMAVALGGVSYLAYDAIEDKGRLAVERDEARRVAQSNADALTSFKAQTAADMKLLSDEADRARKAARGVIVIRQEIARDPEANVRVPEPVDRFLDRLRQPAPGDGNPGREGRDTGTPAPVR